jgi:hypothetical protein
VSPDCNTSRRSNESMDDLSQLIANARYMNQSTKFQPPLS